MFAFIWNVFPRTLKSIQRLLEEARRCGTVAVPWKAYLCRRRAPGTAELRAPTLSVFGEHSLRPSVTAVDVFMYLVEGTCPYTKEQFRNFKMSATTIKRWWYRRFWQCTNTLSFSSASKSSDGVEGEERSVQRRAWPSLWYILTACSRVYR